MSKPHYPSKSRAQRERFADNVRALKQNPAQNLNLAPLVAFSDSAIEADYQRFADRWVNEIANIGAGNSLQQHTRYILERLSYSELAMQATDDLISNAIETITRESLSKWGKFSADSKNEATDTQAVIDYLEARFKELEIEATLAVAMKKALIFGGALVYFNMGGEQELDKPLILSQETRANKLLGVKAIEAWYCSPSSVNLTNPLDKDYMRPSHWHIHGAGNVDSSRLYQLVVFEAPELIRPMFNFLGISLIQFMHDKVKSADTMRKALADIFLRFRTNIIRTPALMSMDSAELRNRVELINLGVNNFSTLLLADNENFEQSITPISGLDHIFAQAQESVASSARIPINKLFGQTPTGLNNSGAYDLQSFYDTIKGYQTTTLKPLILHIARVILNELDSAQGVGIDFNFNPLESINELESAQAKNTEADFYSKLIGAGIITQDEALAELKKLEYISSDIAGADDELGLGEIEPLDLGAPDDELDNGAQR